MSHPIASDAHHILSVVLMALLGAALYTDLKYGKIYNKLTIPCIALGIAGNTLLSGVPGLLSSLGGAAVILAIFLLFARIGGIGGGDVKLLMAVGALMGFQFIVRAMLLSAIAGGVLALVIVARRRMLVSSIRSLGNSLLSSIALRNPLDFSKGPAEMKFRYSPAIVVGTMLTLFFLKF